MKIDNLILSNPRDWFFTDDWKAANDITTCCFRMNRDNGKCQIVKKTGMGKAKTTQWHDAMAVCDGSDGRLYVIGVDRRGTVLIPSTFNGALRLSHLSKSEAYRSMHAQICNLLKGNPQ